MTANTRQRGWVTLLLAMASFIVAHICFWSLPNVFGSWNAQTVDQLFLFRTTSKTLRPVYDNTIVHLDLNNTSIQKLQNHYLNRSHYAQVVRNLTTMQVSVQVYDLIFVAQTDEESDRALTNAVGVAGGIYFGMAFELFKGKRPLRKLPQNEALTPYLEQTLWHVTVEGHLGGFYMGAYPLATFPALASASRGLGFLNLQPDRDGVFRRAPLLVRCGDGFYPSLAFRTICDYLRVSPEQIVLRPGSQITLMGARRPGEEPRDIVIPIDSHGNMIVNYIGAWEAMDHFNFSDILLASDDRDEMEMWGEDFGGKIVLVSEVLTGSSDIGPVPTDTHFPLSGVHANAMHTILTEDFIQEWSGGRMFIVEVLLLGIILVLSFRFSSLVFVLGSLLVVVVYIVVTASCFFYANLILNIVRPLMMVTFAVLSTVTYRYFNEEKEKGILRRSFEAYFPPKMIKKIMANPEIVTASGQKKELTILFSDIKSFSTYTATMAPDHIQRLLNEYFEAMTDIVFEYEGTVDKFIGDGLMVFFGDPEPQTDHALRAVRAAIDMQKRTRQLNAKWSKQGDMPLQIRIGINTGPVVVGNMGSSRRLSYTVLGAAVNLAQRLESSAPVEGIMISQRTFDLVKDQVVTQPLGDVQVKGFEAPIPVHEVLVNGQSVG